jgi:hypothetical protein
MDYKTRLNAILEHLKAGGSVMTVTAYKAIQYKPKHAAMFKATSNGLYVQRGKQWDCLNFTTVKFV